MSYLHFPLLFQKFLYNFHRNKIENEYLVFSSAAITENQHVCIDLNRKWKNYDIKIDIEKYSCIFSNYIAECNSIYI